MRLAEYGAPTNTGAWSLPDSRVMFTMATEVLRVDLYGCNGSFYVSYIHFYSILMQFYWLYGTQKKLGLFCVKFVLV